MPDYQPSTPSTYVTPLLSGKEFTFLSNSAVWGSTVFPGISRAVVVNYNGKEIFNAKPVYREDGLLVDTEPFTMVLQPGTYSVLYGYAIQNADGWSYDVFRATFIFTVIENHYPLKKWTITDVIKRTLDLAEPLRKGEEPRFRLNAEQAALFDNVLAPQFSFTKQTLRECLQEIGKVVHGEPRLTVVKEGGKWLYEIVFDMYGQMERSAISKRHYLIDSLSTAVDNYATHLDSQAENLVNSLDSASGVIVEPFAGGYKSVRTEQQYIRITEQNMVIATQYPIYTIEKLECLPPNMTEAVDITQYVFERSVYNSRLSSYSQKYPYAKSHAIMYTQGEKNITALNFKSDAEKSKTAVLTSPFYKDTGRFSLQDL